MFILFENQYTVGDQVKIGEISGIVETVAVAYHYNTRLAWRAQHYIQRQYIQRC